jgi:hypothetical protein
MLSINTDTDWEVCCWFWQLFELGKAYRPLFLNCNWCISFKNPLGWSAVVFCACEIALLSSEVFYVVRAVHKYFYILLYMKHLTNDEHWKEGHAEIKTHVFDSISMLSPRKSSRVWRNSTHAVQVNCILLSKRHYMGQTRVIFMLIAVQKVEKFPASYGKQLHYSIQNNSSLFPILSQMHLAHHIHTRRFRTHTKRLLKSLSVRPSTCLCTYKWLSG